MASQQDQHDLPVRISVHERHFYEVPGHPGEVFPFEGTWLLSDQLTDEISSGITFYPGDPETGVPLESVAPIRIEYQYLLQWQSEVARRKLHALGTTDVHQLSVAYFTVLKDYNQHFRAKLGA